MKLNRVDYIRIVVANIEEAEAFLRQGFGLEAGPTVEIVQSRTIYVILCYMSRIIC